MVKENQGVNVSGGSFSGEQVVTGPNAQAFIIKNISSQELSKHDMSEVAQAIEALITSITDNSDKISDEEVVLETIQQIAQETIKDRPNKLTIESLLSGVKSVVEPVTEVVQKVDVLKTAVMALLGV